MKRLLSRACVFVDVPVEGLAMYILIVDDEPDLCEYLQRVICGLGHEADIALSGAGAILTCSKRMPNIIFMDFQMPGMSGAEAGRRIKKMGGKVIFLSGNTCPLAGETCMQKPVCKKDLEKIITDLEHSVNGQ